MKTFLSRSKNALLLTLLCAAAFTCLAIIRSSVSASATAAATSTINVYGRVFQDYNGNGVYDISGSASSPAIDDGIAGVVVTAYDPNNAACGTTTTFPGTPAVKGTYNLTVTGTGPYRIEFTNLPAGYFPSASSVDSDSIVTPGISLPNAGTTEQFIPNQTTEGINLGVNYPSDYCQNNPDICINQYVNGDTNNTAGWLPTIWRLPYGIANGEYPAGPQTAVANKTQVGSTWGLAYSRKDKRIYSAAFLKRHMGLAGGLGDIFVSNTSLPANGSLFVTIPNAGTIANNGGRGLGAPTVPNNDPTTFDQIGKIGLGDIDISEDDSTLYAVNLNDKSLYKIVMDSDNNPSTNPAAADITGYPIPNPGCGKTANPIGIKSGVWRPFAVGIYRGDVYVGGVCDASGSQSTSDLRAAVYKFSGGSFNTTPVLVFPLNYPKGEVLTECPGHTGWHPWLDTMPALATNCTLDSLTRLLYPQPILSDIVFDNDGSMMIGFSDRMGHQEGASGVGTSGTTFYTTVGGDILRTYNNAGNFVLEQNGQAGSINGSGAGNNQGPAGGEFYGGDIFSTLLGVTTVAHQEVGEGGLAMLPGANSVVMTAMDPNVKVNTGGVAWLYNSSLGGGTPGGKNKGYSIFPNSAGTEFYAKSNGVGDVELMCDLAPIEIGNRVWRDNDGDGIQDAGEPGIPGVTVRLFKGGSLVTGATAVTDPNGEYYFSSAAGASTPNRIYNVAVLPNTAYEIRLDNPANYSGAPLNGLFLTAANAGTNDSIDSDAIGSPPGILPVISLTTGGAGANDHTYDVGFTEKQKEACCGTGENHVINGSFNDGPKGFESGFTLAEQLTPGDYTVGNSETAEKNCDNWDILGHTNCEKDDNFLIVNGMTNQTTGNALAWGQSVPVKPSDKEQVYHFCAWFKDLKQCCFNQEPKITLEADIKGNTLSHQTTTISAPSDKCGWQLVSTDVTVPPGATNVNLQIFLDQNADGDGNDVAIDDISFASSGLVPAGATDFNIATQVISGTTNYNITATPVNPQKPDCKYFWIVTQLDANGNEIMTSPIRQIWPIGSTFNFAGYMSGTISAGIFQTGITYRIIYRTECDCGTWREDAFDIRRLPSAAGALMKGGKKRNAKAAADKDFVITKVGSQKPE
jgi:hypothetical protein